MNTDKVQSEPVVFKHPCPECHGTIRYVNGRPLKHDCWWRQDDATATPWKVTE